MKKKIYLASSWKNIYQPGVLATLRLAGHEVYDFRNPKPGDPGFSWTSVAEGWRDWDMENYRKGLQHPVAQAGFKLDFDAMKWADTCVLLLPSGRSAHIEAGWMVGAGKKLVIVSPLREPIEPELMYLVGGDCIRDSLPEILDLLEA